MLTKTELIELWKEYDFRPLKRLGQIFLVDKNIKDKILCHLDLTANDTVIEIGAGFGELTIDLARMAKQVFAVEKDKKIARILKNHLGARRNVTIIEQDFLDTDIAKITGGKKAIIYGNLPYYITSPIIEKLIANLSLIKAIYLMVQKEVAQRMSAMPGSRNIGRLSLYAQYYTVPTKIFNISKNCFYPVPKVDSAFLRLGVRKARKIKVKDEALLFEIIKKAYGQRRKTILNSLAGPKLKKDELVRILREAKIDPSARPEQLSLEDFSRLTNLL